MFSLLLFLLFAVISGLGVFLLSQWLVTDLLPLLARPWQKRTVIAGRAAASSPTRQQQQPPPVRPRPPLRVVGPAAREMPSEQLALLRSPAFGRPLPTVPERRAEGRP